MQSINTADWDGQISSFFISGIIVQFSITIYYTYFRIHTVYEYIFVANQLLLVVRLFAHGVMGHWIDPTWWTP